MRSLCYRKLLLVSKNYQKKATCTHLPILQSVSLSDFLKMKYFINVPACNQVFGCVADLGEDMPFHRTFSQPLLLPPTLGSQMILSMHEGNFYGLITCPSAREKSSAAACSAEEPQGIPAENTASQA